MPSSRNLSDSENSKRTPPPARGQSESGLGPWSRKLGTGLAVSTLEIACAEVPGFDCRHGFRWVILDASRWDSLESGPLQRLLQFVATDVAPRDDTLLSLVSDEMDAANADTA